MRQQKRHKKNLSLKDSIFIKDGNYTFFLPVSILVILVLASWSWILLAIPPVSDMAENVIAKHFGRESNIAVANKDMQDSDSPEDKSRFGSLLTDNYLSSNLNSESIESENIKKSKYDTPAQDVTAADNAPAAEDGTEVQETANANPEIFEIKLSSGDIYTSGSYDITAEATDAEGQQLTYKWTVSSGSLESGQNPSVKWTAPQDPGICEITVEVTDALGATGSKTVSVDILAAQNDEEEGSQSQETQVADQTQDAQPGQDQETAASSTSGPVRKIVFVSNQTGNKDIFSMNLDGSKVTQLTSGGQADMYPAVSPDGKKIVYSSAIGTTWQIFTMNWDGSDKKQLTNLPYRCGFPSWSYDASHIFFEIYEEGSWEIYVMASNGSDIRRLTLKPGIDNWHPCAHPSKNVTLYESGYSGKEEIWQIDINGESNKRISKPGRNYRVPKYSPDATKIAFMGKDGKGREQVYIMDANGDNIRQLTDTPDQARLPSFSPDGKYIVFNTIGGGSEIFIMNADGSGKKQLTNFPGEDEVAVFMYH